MTTQGTCHFDANLTIMQQGDEQIYDCIILRGTYMTLRGTCHFDAGLAIMQQGDEQIHDYAEDRSF
jgi:hypothetical protein